MRKHVCSVQGWLLMEERHQSYHQSYHYCLGFSVRTCRAVRFHKNITLLELSANQAPSTEDRPKGSDPPGASTPGESRGHGRVLVHSLGACLAPREEKPRRRFRTKRGLFSRWRAGCGGREAGTLSM